MKSSFVKFDGARVATWAEARLQQITKLRNVAWERMLLERQAARKRRWLYRLGLLGDLTMEKLKRSFYGRMDSPALLHWEAEDTCKRMLKLARVARDTLSPVYVTAKDFGAIHG